MQSDFKHATGRHDEKGNELYNESDLYRGFDYADGWLEAGETRDLIGNFDLAEFRRWCLSKFEAA